MNDILQNVLSMIQDAGCQDARLVMLRNTEQSLSVINQELDKVQRSESQSLAITLYMDGREGFFYTNVLDEEALLRFVRQSVDTTRLLAPDPSLCLVSPHRYYRGNGPDLQNYDDTLLQTSVEQKQALAFAQNAEVYGVDPRVNSVDTRYVDRTHNACYLTSNGFRGSERSSRVTLSTIVSVQGEGDARPMDGWGQTRLFLKDMPREGIGRMALDRTLRKIGQRPVPSGRYTMVVESPVAGSLLQPLFSAMSGQALQQHASFLEGKIDQQIGSPLLDAIDNPHLPGTLGASYFDYDGAATQPLQLFDKGRLCTYFIDTPMSVKLQMPPTTQSTHHVIFTPSARLVDSSPVVSASSLSDVLRQQGECILVTDFNGGNCNPVTGHYSYGIEGFLCRDGVYVQPISGMNITGSMLHLWQHLIQVAGDADPFDTDLIPSLVFEDISFS